MEIPYTNLLTVSHYMVNRTFERKSLNGGGHMILTKVKWLNKSGTISKQIV